MADDDAAAWEIELDHEGIKERKWRERQYLRAGIGEFPAFRLSLLAAHELDWQHVVAHKQRGISDDQLIDLYLD
jgi:hypothetical protein